MQQQLTAQQQQQQPQQQTQQQAASFNSQSQPAANNSSTSDFSLEFLDNIASENGGQFSTDAQELLNSFDAGMGFSLLDTL